MNVKKNYRAPWPKKVEDITEDDIQIISDFVRTGDRVYSYNLVYGPPKYDSVHIQTIWRYYQLPAVKAKLKELQAQMDIFDIVVDNKLIAIINDRNARYSDVVKAISEYNKLHSRVVQKVELTEAFNTAKISDESLDALVKQIKKEIGDND